MTTLKDIAKAANCSLATVSKAINDKHDISAKTRQRILKIAEEYNFVPNAFGKGLKKQRTENIGVIFCREFQPLSVNPFYSRVLEGIEAELAINNYNLVLHLLPEVYRGEYPKMLRERHVDGVVLVGVLEEAFINRLQSDNIPTILIDPKIITDDFSQILIDNEYGGYQATRFLINHGHERVAFISGDLNRESFRLRYSGYLKALKTCGLPVNQDYIQTGGLENGYEHVSALIKCTQRPTAIFAANDINAIYGCQAVKDHNLTIPDDISIIGFDDIEMAKMMTPALTTVRVYKEEMGSIAVRKLFGIINKTEKLASIIVPVRIVERDTVKSIK
jgi:LacI family transcriptional regulator